MHVAKLATLALLLATATACGAVEYNEDGERLGSAAAPKVSTIADSDLEKYVIRNFADTGKSVVCLGSALENDSERQFGTCDFTVVNGADSPALSEEGASVLSVDDITYYTIDVDGKKISCVGAHMVSANERSWGSCNFAAHS